MIDWSEAGLIGGIGFATVILVLAVLAIVVYALGAVLKRWQKGESTPQRK